MVTDEDRYDRDEGRYDRMDMQKELRKAYRESTEHMESISALELMKNAGLFMSDLKKLINSQRLPAAVLIGCLMSEVNRLATETEYALLDDKLTKMFGSFKRYMDENFMKKE